MTDLFLPAATRNFTNQERLWLFSESCQGNLKFQRGKTFAYHANQVQVCLLTVPHSLASLAWLGEILSYFLHGASEDEKCSSVQYDASKR